VKFNEQSFPQRMERMGDEAEGEFERHNANWLRYGFNRPDFPIYVFPNTIRYTPDYIQGGPEPRLVEVLGMGRNGLKLKLEKINALAVWNSFMPVWFWMWSTPKQDFSEMRYQDLVRIINKEDVPLGKFSEGKAYFNIRPSLLTWNDGDG
tara:strand:- start:888 stop:1337 length:450 start_codon:yes stop_codon:yes gene_type:complete